MDKSQLDSIPKNTGVYKFYNKEGDILYIGKALNLKARVKSYFQNTHFDRPHIIPMISLINDVEVIETNNEIESLILESALIKKYKPKFNLELKDDKSYSWIFISLQEKFPRVSIIRSIKKGDYEQGELFGPYPRGKTIKSIFNYVRKIHPFRTCKDMSKGPCLYYHLDLCTAPCIENISSKEYKKNIESITKFLRGEERSILNSLKSNMKKYAQKQEFEKAIILRDKLDDLEYLSQGINISPWENLQEDTEQEKIQKFFKLLKRKFGINNDIRRIECFDVSSFKGQSAYGSMSVSVNSELNTGDYRVFKIKENKEDDISMMCEVLQRRFKFIDSRVKDSSLSVSPDLVILDGGKAHLQMLKKYIPDKIPLLGISKGKYLKKENQKLKDELWIFTGTRVEKIDISQPKLFIRLRDEAHRFGIKHYRKNIQKNLRKSDLDKIEGIGQKRKKLLLKYFKTLSNIKKASFEEINAVLKNKNVSRRVYDHLRSKS